jgi:LacI family transcriptional regulator, galactose operon repressor
MPSDKKIGVRELARLANVSVGTVDRALNGRGEISEATRQRILALAEQQGYQPNLAARALSVKRSRIRIGVCLPRHFHVFYDQIRDGILNEASRFKHLGVEILFHPTDHLGLNEAGVVSGVLDSGVRALILTPGDPVALAPIIDNAETERNIRVICVASDDSQSRRSTWIAVDPKMNGMMAAELMANFLPPASRTAIVTGFLKTEDHLRKVEGFSEVFPCECFGGRVVEVIEGHDYEEETYKKTLRFLQGRRQVEGIYVSTAICLPVCRALEETGKAGKIKVIATDLFLEAVPHLLSRTIAAIIHQRPYTQGQLAVRFLVDHIVNGSRLPERHAIDPAVVLKANLATFREVRNRADVVAASQPRAGGD